VLIDVSKDLYRKHFAEDPHPFITEAFIGLVEHKMDEIVRLSPLRKRIERKLR
jgi:hypothetical protein